MSPAKKTGEPATAGKRRERRIIVKLPMWVRGTDPDGVRFEESTRTENVCRSGLAFFIRHAVAPGTDLEISIPMPARGNDPHSDFATRGRVVHVEMRQEPNENFVGVAFTGPRFNRVFVPETA